MPSANEILRQSLEPAIWTVGAVGTLAVAIYVIRTWWRDNDGPAASEHDLLAEYRESNQRGELSDEEFRIIKSRIASRLGWSSSLQPGSNAGGSSRKVAQPGQNIEPTGEEAAEQQNQAGSEPDPTDPITPN